MHGHGDEREVLYTFGNISDSPVCSSSTSLCSTEINGSSTRCQKKLFSFVATSNLHSVEKSKWVLKRKYPMTRSGMTDEKYGLWWKTNRCMLYWCHKCRKTRCGIPYNIVLNVLKYIFPKEASWFFFSVFFLSSYSYYSDCNFIKLLREQNKSLWGFYFYMESRKSHSGIHV